MEPEKDLKYNHEDWIHKLLPYYDEIKKGANHNLSQIITSIGRAIILQNLNDILYWTRLLMQRYIGIHGWRFSKEQHVLLAEIYFSLVTTADLNLNLVNQFGWMLDGLLSKRRVLSRYDLILPWRPLFDIYWKTVWKDVERNGLFMLNKNFKSNLKSLIEKCRNYFPLQATDEILQEMRQYMYPWSTIFIKVMELLEVFLPMTLTAEEHSKFGANLWFSDIWYWFAEQWNEPPWTFEALRIFSRLSRESPNYMDWSAGDYCEIVFTAILRNLQLKVAIGNQVISTGNDQVFPFYSTGCLIAQMVGDGNNLTQKCVSKLTDICQTYLNPFNSGDIMDKCTENMIEFLANLVISVCLRVHKERYCEKSDWIEKRPPESQLTEKQIEDFVYSALPCIEMAIYRESCSDNALKAMKSLSRLAPKLVLPVIMINIEQAIETETEPQRFVPSIQCFIDSAIMIIRDKGNCEKPGIRSELFPVIQTLIPFINYNDQNGHDKSLQILKAFRVIFTVVPLDNCSKFEFKDDEEKMLSLQSAQIPDLITKLLDKLFEIIFNIEASYMSQLIYDEKIQPDLHHNDEVDMFFSAAVQNLFYAITFNSDVEIFMLVADKINNFILQNTFTSEWAICTTADMMNSIIIFDSKFWSSFFVFVFDKVNENITEDIATNEDPLVSSELIWYIRLTKDLLLLDGDVTIENREKILKLLHMISPIKHIQLVDDISNIFARVLTSLCCTSLPITQCKETFTAEHIFFHWAKPFDRENDELRWDVPTEEKLDFAKELLERFLKPHLEALKEPYCLTKHDVERSLKLLLACIRGMSEVLPCMPGNDQKWKNCAPASSLSCCSATHNCAPVLNWTNGNNIRQTIFDAVHPLINFLLANRPDETKNLVLACDIYSQLMFYFGAYKEDYDSCQQALNKFQEILGDKVRGSKMDAKCIVRWKGQKEHKLLFFKRGDLYHCTEMHLKIMKDLMKLSMNTYKTVRISAQKVFDQFVQTFWNCHELFIDDLISAIRSDSKTDNKKLVGALFILTENKDHLSIGAMQDWSTLNKIWLEILQIDPSSFQSPSYHVGFRPEKSTVVSLIDNLFIALKSDFCSFPIYFQLDEKQISLAKKLWSVVPKTEQQQPTEPEIEAAKIRLGYENEQRLISYYQLNESILKQLSGKLHWTFEFLGNLMLNLLIRYDIPIPESVVRHFLQALIHESIKMRLGAVQIVTKWLTMKKPKAVKCKVMVPTGVSEFGSCVLTDNHTQYMYQKRKLPRTENEWDNTLFMDKQCLLFWNWPQNAIVAAPAVMQIARNRNQNSLSVVERDFLSHFSDRDFVKKLIDLMTASDEFPIGLVQMFKLLFITFNDMFLPAFLPFVEELSKEDNCEKQKMAACIVFGALAGSKLWKYEKVQKLNEWLTSFLEIFFQKLDEDKMHIWLPVMEALSQEGDQRRFWSLFKLLFKLIGQNVSSYQNNTRLKLLCTLINGLWHASELYRELFDIVIAKIPFAQDCQSNILAGCLHRIVRCSGINAQFSDKQLNPMKLDLVLNMFFEKLGKHTAQSDAVSLNNNKEMNFEIHFLRLCFHYFLEYFNDGHSVIHKSEPQLKRKLKTKQNFNSESVEQRINIQRVFLDFLLAHFGPNWTIIPQSLFKLLPIILSPDFENHGSDMKNRFDSVLSTLSQSRICQKDIPEFVDTCEQIIETANFKAKVALLNMLNVFLLTNFYAFLSNSRNTERLEKIIVISLCDSRFEVRSAAHETLAGILMSRMVTVHSTIIEKFIDWSNNDDLMIRHGGVLGLLSIIRAFPYTLPHFLPKIFVQLADHTGAPSPIKECIKKGIRTFRETHQECWNEHKIQFTESQLQIYSDLSGASNHYV